jgi:hypothetical protein
MTNKNRVNRVKNSFNECRITLKKSKKRSILINKKYFRKVLINSKTSKK